MATEAEDGRVLHRCSGHKIALDAALGNKASSAISHLFPLRVVNRVRGGHIDSVDTDAGQGVRSQK